MCMGLPACLAGAKGGAKALPTSMSVGPYGAICLANSDTNRTISRKIDAIMASLWRRNRRKTTSNWLSALGIGSGESTVTAFGLAVAAVIVPPTRRLAKLDPWIDHGVKNITQQRGDHG